MQPSGGGPCPKEWQSTTPLQEPSTMPLAKLRPSRLLVAGLVLLRAACSPPAPASAQGLAARVEAVPNGVVRFSFPSREGVCGVDDGIGYRRPGSDERSLSFFGSMNVRRGRDLESGCVAGPLHVAVTRTGREVSRVRARVSAPPNATGPVTDPGRA